MVLKLAFDSIYQGESLGDFLLAPTLPMGRPL